jgi:hypothetical protein
MDAAKATKKDITIMHSDIDRIESDVPVSLTKNPMKLVRYVAAKIPMPLVNQLEYPFISLFFPSLAMNVDELVNEFILDDVRVCMSYKNKKFRSWVLQCPAYRQIMDNIADGANKLAPDAVWCTIDKIEEKRNEIENLNELHIKVRFTTE